MSFMDATPTPEQALSDLLPADIGALDAASAAAALGSVRSIRSYLDAYEARVTTHVRSLHDQGSSAPAADLHTRDGKVSAREAKTKERRAETLEQAPSLAEKLAAGDVTSAHADALANAMSGIDDDTRRELLDHEGDLAADAARMTPEQFGRACRDLIRMLTRDQGIERDRRQRRETRATKTIDRDGMYVLNARMHPELGHAVFNMLAAETARLVKQGGDRSVDRRTVAAEALGNLITGGHQAARPHEAEVRVHITAERLIDDACVHGVCELDDGTPLPPPSVRRLICNGTIVPIILDTDGVAMNAGREYRLANRHQRRALRAMYRTCAFAGCDVPFSRCEIHHILEWELLGPTDLANLLPVCSRHHHVVHELGLRLHLDERRTLTIEMPDGEVFAVSPLTTEPTATPERPPPRPAPPPGQLGLIA